MVTAFTSPKEVESVVELATDKPEDRPFPKIDISEPGAIDLLLPRPAALTTPPGVMVGVCANTRELKINKPPNRLDIRDRMSPYSPSSNYYVPVVPSERRRLPDSCRRSDRLRVLL